MKTFSMTHVGQRRETNQDYMYTSETAVGCLPNLFIVADGMGGHAAGDFASRFTVERIVEYLGSAAPKEPVAALKEAVRYANGLLFEESKRDPQKAGMGTTLVIAVNVDNKLYTANIGDSRLYVISRARIMQITRDHSVVGEMVRRGELEPSEAKHHPDRNKITRAVGVQQEVTVDFFETWLEHGDIILMCTDGLTNMVDDMEIRRIVLGQRDIAEQAERLVAAANENGGSDNITVVLIEPYSEEG